MHLLTHKKHYSNNKHAIFGKLCRTTTTPKPRRKRPHPRGFGHWIPPKNPFWESRTHPPFFNSTQPSQKRPAERWRNRKLGQKQNNKNPNFSVKTYENKQKATLHPGKFIYRTWKSPAWKGKLSEPNLQFLGCRLIFRGVAKKIPLVGSPKNAPATQAQKLEKPPMFRVVNFNWNLNNFQQGHVWEIPVPLKNVTVAPKKQNLDQSNNISPTLDKTQ